ncbi:MAG: DUF362 domain-containing protein [Armatimonadota bacterium]|nr:DUF362 domain-containing protein [Armatimonadota bacterium]
MKGRRIAITAGSRGIASIPAVLRGVVKFVRESGGEPFLFPAMGSHGGATADGQRQVLRDYGIDEEFVGAPILATMEVEKVGQLNGIPLFTDRHAAESDGIIVVNRIKHHTDFTGPHESGLLKMMVVGMGKREGALVAHRDKADSLRRDIPKMAEALLQKLPIVAGLAVVENGYHQVGQLVSLLPSEIVEGDRRLLSFWKRIRPRIPFCPIDVLIVERMGKDISGTGMDTKVIGRMMITGGVEPKWPLPRVIVVLDLTDASHGNAAGLGLADITTRRLIQKVDWKKTHINVFTSGFIERDRIPVVAENDREALEWALEVAKVRDPSQARIVRIRDTNSLGTFYASEGLWEEARKKPSLRLGSVSQLEFDGSDLKPVDYESDSKK